MKRSSLGENLNREWDEEPHAPELWDALQAIKSDPRRGLAMLTHLAESGSSLAMMYLGRVFLRGKHGFRMDQDLGENWLRRSAAAGSIEAAYDLALELLKIGKPDEGIAELRRLSDLKYSPALAALGLEYENGGFVEKDLNRALFYYRLAEKEGHLIASNQICFILMRRQMGPLSWLHGMVKKAKLFIPFVLAKVKHPHSDRFSI